MPVRARKTLQNGRVFKRVVWFGIGAATGAAAAAAGTVWAEQQVRRRLDALGPDHLVVTAGNTARKVGRTVVDAVSEGRTTMRDREDELRARRDRRDRGERGPVPRPGHGGRPGRPDQPTRPSRPTRPASW
jgi:hypothetical protein